MRNIGAAQDELGLALGGLMAKVAQREGFMSNLSTLMTILYSTSRINRLFLIHYSLPEDLV